MTTTTQAFRYQLASFIDFRESAECARVRAISREDFARHANPNFRISVVEERSEFYEKFAIDLVGRIRTARDEGKQFVAIMPVGPTQQYGLAARRINDERLSLSHVHTFNMDEWANEDGVTAPPSWSASFQHAMQDMFFSQIDRELRPPEEQIHFPSSDTIRDYGAMIEALGGADVCYGGVGWCGHFAFWESSLGHEFAGDLDAFRRAGPRTVELHPMTIMQSALLSFGGDWSLVPPQGVTIGPKELLSARHRSFWIDGSLGAGAAWQRFIARLVAHGPVSEWVPASLLQTVATDYVVVGDTASNVEIYYS